MPGYDVAIIGLGAMGSFTALELARRGAKVIGFDRFSPPHENGSNGGETRAFAPSTRNIPITKKCCSGPDFPATGSSSRP